MDIQEVKMYFIRYKYVIIFFIVLLVLLLTLTTNLFLVNETEVLTYENNLVSDVQVEEETKADTIFIDIKGGILKPGVYEMGAGVRVIDAVYLAGGFTDDAITDNVNLSKKLVDESVVIIPKNIDEENSVSFENNCLVEGVITEEETSTNESIVNLNAASLEQLMTLSGIGETKAKAIIEYRDTNGGFKNIEEIKNVSGIGESTFEKIKDFIKV